MASGFYPPIDPLAPKRIGVSALEAPDRCVANYLRLGVNPWEEAWWSQLEDSRPATSRMWSAFDDESGNWVLSVRAACTNTHALGVMCLSGSITGELSVSLGEPPSPCDEDPETTPRR